MITIELLVVQQGTDIQMQLTNMLANIFLKFWVVKINRKEKNRVLQLLGKMRIVYLNKVITSELQNVLQNLWFVANWCSA